jgi:hypothetical protein
LWAWHKDNPTPIKALDNVFYVNAAYRDSYVIMTNGQVIQYFERGNFESEPYSHWIHDAVKLPRTLLFNADGSYDMAPS